MNLQEILQSIDIFNQSDPKQTTIGNTLVSSEIAYSQRMLACLNAYQPNANQLLQIAIYGQHIGRWKIARGEYPSGREGYLKWRKALASFHADQLTAIMHQQSCKQEDIDRVRDIVQKKNFKRDPDAQTLEDIACLVFLKYYFDDFSDKHSEEKVLHILAKSLNKMSSTAIHFSSSYINNPKLTQYLNKIQL